MCIHNKVSWHSILRAVANLQPGFIEDEDYTALWNNLREEISLVKCTTPGPGQGSFGHITGGYDAGYYGYAVSSPLSPSTLITNFQIHLLAGVRRGHVCDRVQESAT